MIVELAGKGDADIALGHVFPVCRHEESSFGAWGVVREGSINC